MPSAGTKAAVAAVAAVAAKHVIQQLKPDSKSLKDNAGKSRWKRPWNCAYLANTSKVFRGVEPCRQYCSVCFWCVCSSLCEVEAESDMMVSVSWLNGQRHVLQVVLGLELAWSWGFPISFLSNYKYAIAILVAWDSWKFSPVYLLRIWYLIYGGTKLSWCLNAAKQLRTKTLQTPWMTASTLWKLDETLQRWFRTLFKMLSYCCTVLLSNCYSCDSDRDQSKLGVAPLLRHEFCITQSLET